MLSCCASKASLSYNQLKVKKHNGRNSEQKKRIYLSAYYRTTFSMDCGVTLKRAISADIPVHFSCIDNVYIKTATTFEMIITVMNGKGFFKRKCCFSVYLAEKLDENLYKVHVQSELHRYNSFYSRSFRTKPSFNVSHFHLFDVFYKRKMQVHKKTKNPSKMRQHQRNHH